MKLIDILVDELPKRGGWPEGAKCITQDGDWKVEPASCHPSVAKCDGDGFWFLDSSRIGGFEVDTLASDYTTAIITREQYDAALAAKNDGWIEWGGGECPVPRGTLVDVRYRNGDENHHVGAGLSFCDTGSNPDLNAEDWSKDNSSSDIIAYRLHQPQEVEQAEAGDEADLNDCIGQALATEWNGEGLPPVGCECEHSWAGDGDEWLLCKILFTSNQIVVVKVKESGVEDAYNIGDVTFRPVRSEEDEKHDKKASAIDGFISGFRGQETGSNKELAYSLTDYLVLLEKL